MRKDQPIRPEKRKGLSDEELIARYEAGQQPVDEIVKAMLDKPNPKAPKKVDKGKK